MDLHAIIECYGACSVENMCPASIAMAVDRVRFATYVMCGMFAGLTGYLVSGFSGGAALNMGAEYLLASIAVVVIGGTSVAGGFANLPGFGAQPCCCSCS